MNWNNIQLVFRRELTDQIRDRRTLFTILVLPLILYPLLGMALLQTAQFMHKAPATVWIIGSEHLEGTPQLIDGDRFGSNVVDEKAQSLLTVQTDLQNPDFATDAIIRIAEGTESNKTNLSDDARKWLQQQIQRRNADVLVVIPKSISKTKTNLVNELNQVPSIQIFVNSAKDKSAIAGTEVNRILANWRAQLIESNFSEMEIPFSLAFPFAIEPTDIVDANTQKAAVWAKILPFVVMLWALTGAFYPAIDLCAGEKERGTLETLLSSPAARSEIVVGKMFTIMVFSVSNAVLNLFSMALTGLLVLQHLQANAPIGVVGQVGLPPVSAFPWIIIGLLPIAALFSALALALASFARSSKEGQYYLIPLLMLLLPLMMLSVLPSAELDLGTSLIPVTGMMLLLRNMIDGNHAAVVQFAGPVLAVTIVCCYLAVRWAVSQFNNENVLFRASEQFGVGLWVKQVFRDRAMKPTIGHAVLCLFVILITKFFMGMAVRAPGSWGEFTKQILIVQIATIAVPTILMAAVLTRNPKLTLRLTNAKIGVLCAAVLLAILAHPALSFVGKLVMHIYPASPELLQLEVSIAGIVDSAPSIFAILFVFALVPAVCEELAFRGYVLSGLESLRGKWTAILISSLFFGATHAVFQQSIMAFITGCILGIIAVRTGSLLPCILFHMTHNGMTVITSQFRELASSDSVFQWLFVEVTHNGQTSVDYSPVAAIFMGVAAFLLLIWIWRQGTGNPNSNLQSPENSANAIGAGSTLS